MAEIDKTQLSAIAHALGVSLDAFYTDVPRGEIIETAALFQFWSRIGDVQGRKRVLSLARQEAERFDPRSGDGS